MCLLMYSNTQDGAFVQVQVTPHLPNNGNTYLLTNVDNVTPWTASTILRNENRDIKPQLSIPDDPIAMELIIDEIIEFIQHIYSKHPYLEIANTYDHGIDFEYLHSHRNNISAMLSTIPNININETYKMEVFSFTLTSSIDDFWNAKAYSLAIIIATFSGAWPYIKLLLLLLIWLHPMKENKRKKGLLLLDQLGKYSFIDLYVCIFMVVSFYLTITEQTRSGLGINVAVVVQIDTGVTTFAVATLVSMVYSMVFLYFDEQKRLQKSPITDEQEEPIMLDDEPLQEPYKADIDCFEHRIEKYSTLYLWKYDKTCRIYALSDVPTSVLGILWRCTFLLLCVGNIWLCVDVLYTAPVRYDIEGLAGWAVSDNVRSFSIKRTADLLPSSTDAYGAAWFCVIQYYMTVLIAPIVISTVIVCVWFVPMNYRMHNLVCRLLYPLQAWNALDVFLVGTVAASIELDEVSQWIINSNFAQICGDGGYVDNIFDTGCFSVVGNLTRGTGMLIVFVVLEWFALLYTRNHIYNTHAKWARIRFQSSVQVME
eukprot:247109_1